MPTPPSTAPTLRVKSNGKVCFNPITGRLIAGPSFGCACTIPCGCTDGNPKKLRVTLSGFDLPTIYAFFQDRWGYGDCRTYLPIEPNVPNIDGEYIVTNEVTYGPCTWMTVEIPCAYVWGNQDGHSRASWYITIAVFIGRRRVTDILTGKEPGMIFFATVYASRYQGNSATLPWGSDGAGFFRGEARLPFEDEENHTGTCYAGPITIANEEINYCLPAPSTVIEGATVTVETIDDSSSVAGSSTASSEPSPFLEPCPPGPEGSTPGSSDPGSSEPGSSMPDSSEVGSSNPGSSNPGSSTPGSSNPGSNPGDSSGGGPPGSSDSPEVPCTGIIVNGCCLPEGTWSQIAVGNPPGTLSLTRVNADTMNYTVTSGPFTGNHGTVTRVGTQVRVQDAVTGYDQVKPVICTDDCTRVDYGGGDYWESCAPDAGDNSDSTGGGTGSSDAGSGSSPVDLNDIIFVGLSESPSGDWPGLYGTDGYAMAGDVATVTPSWLTSLSILGSEYVWAYTTSDTRALLNPDDPPNRIAATFESPTTLQIELQIAGTDYHYVAIYMVNWDNARIQQRIVGFDNSQEQTNHIIDFSGSKGIWAVYLCRRNVRFLITDSAIYNPIASGIFFGRAELP